MKVKYLLSHKITIKTFIEFHQFLNRMFCTLLPLQQGDENEVILSYLLNSDCVPYYLIKLRFYLLNLILLSSVAFL